jgi:putative molybdenum carrier protein
LDAALVAGTPCGGWCPADRLAEDGRVPDKYPLRELPGGGYPERTLANVRDSDGTVVIYAGKLEGGTEHTALLCAKLGKPYQLIDGNSMDITGAVELITPFIARNRIETLNVAGPRVSKQPQLYAYAYAVIAKLLQRMGTTA